MSWNPKKLNPEELNNGNEFLDGIDAIRTVDINALFNSQIFVQYVIERLAATSETLTSEQQVSVDILRDASGYITLNFGIPKGKDGDKGDTGDVGTIFKMNPTYNALTTYYNNLQRVDIVTIGGSSYYPKNSSVIGVSPPNSTYWNDFALKGQDGQGGNVVVSDLQSLEVGKSYAIKVTATTDNILSAILVEQGEEVQPFNIDEAFTERISATNDYEIEDGQAKVIEVKGNTIKQVVKNNGYGGFTNTTNYVANASMCTASLVNNKIKLTAFNSSVAGLIVTKYGETFLPEKNYAVKLNIDTNFYEVQSTDTIVNFRFTGPEGQSIQDYSKNYINRWWKFKVPSIMTNFSIGHYEVGVDFTQVNFYLNSIEIIELTDEQALLTVEELEQLIPKTLPYGITNSIINSYSTVGDNLVDIKDYRQTTYGKSFTPSICPSLNNIPRDTDIYISFDVEMDSPVSVYGSVTFSIDDTTYYKLKNTAVQIPKGELKNLTLYTNSSSPNANISNFRITLNNSDYEPYNKQTITFPNVELSQWDRLYSPSGDMAVDLVKDNNTGKLIANGTLNYALLTQNDVVIAFSYKPSNRLENSEVLSNNFTFDNSTTFTLKNYDNVYGGLSIVYTILKSKLSTPDTAGFTQYMAENPDTVSYITIETTQEQQTPLVSDSLPISNYGLELQDTNGVATTMDIKYLLDDKSQLLELSHDTANLKKKVAALESKENYKMNHLDVTTIGSAGDDYVEFEDDVIFYKGVRLSGEPTFDDEPANKGYVDKFKEELMLLSKEIPVNRSVEIYADNLYEPGQYMKFSGEIDINVGLGRKDFIVKSSVPTTDITDLTYDDQTGILNIIVVVLSFEPVNVTVNYSYKLY